MLIYITDIPEISMYGINSILGENGLLLDWRHLMLNDCMSF